ncbi:Helix-turn-helix domain-containing protein [Psychrobacillus sp. OK028]|uniref:helix-turn-helix domain-containing protein n=1 Tax=Psychrobacillus sp. OK028 TaxID=1884359 RepID=UPI0008845EE2|nr:helix-turn-helix domain-containing protein [Psychrobacillus sp. OK028]SDN76924.1 Helix-turn-helix domain-containing protein [Psychrobacillus sp. OK028]
MTIYLNYFQSFNTVQEMDMHVEKHVMANYGEMNETDCALVSLLAQYACKFPGAAHLKVETICKAMDKSEATVRRTLRKLEKLAIIKKVPTIRRVSKGYGANILVILPFDDHSHLTTRREETKPVKQSDEPIILQKETNISLISKKELLHNTYSREKVCSVNSVDNYPENRKATFYQRFKSTVFAMLGKDQQLVSRLYGVYRSLTYRTIQLFPQEQKFYENVGYQVLTISLHAMKKKKIRNLSGYFVGVFEEICKRELFEFFQEQEE